MIEIIEISIILFGIYQIVDRIMDGIENITETKYPPKEDLKSDKYKL
jgi:hypothetical protein